jgi:hypothetical protein
MKVEVDLFGVNEQGEVKMVTVKVRVPDDGYQYHVVGESEPREKSFIELWREMNDEIRN